MKSNENIVAVSDLHLGAASSLVSIARVQQRLIEALMEYGPITHFVLLGDILDLTMAPSADAWNQATVFFQTLFKELGQIDCVHYIPGNHDHHVWALLVERYGILCPLEESLASGQRQAIKPILKPLELVRSFGPRDNTFVHALFPYPVRNKLHIHYPTLPLPLGENKVLLAHHGHYFDWKIAPLVSRICRLNKEDEEKVEECNFAWIESMFYSAAIGRVSKEFLTKTYWRYQKLVAFLKALSLRGIIAEDPEKKIGGISIKRIKKTIRNLYNRQEYVLVFGHTHKKGEYPKEKDTAATIEMYNTGGWLVEGWEKNSPHVTPMIFHAKGGICKLDRFSVEPDEIREAADKARNISPIGS